MKMTLPAKATCGNCLAELQAYMVIDDGRVRYDPARYIIFGFTNWHMEYFQDTHQVYACPQCHRALSYIVVPEVVYDST